MTLVKRNTTNTNNAVVIYIFELSVIWSLGFQLWLLFKEKENVLLTLWLGSRTVKAPTAITESVLNNFYQKKPPKTLHHL